MNIIKKLQAKHHHFDDEIFNKWMAFLATEEKSPETENKDEENSKEAENEWAFPYFSPDGLINTFSVDQVIPLFKRGTKTAYYKITRIQKPDLMYKGEVWDDGNKYNFEFEYIIDSKEKKKIPKKIKYGIIAILVAVIGYFSFQQGHTVYVKKKNIKAEKEKYTPEFVKKKIEGLKRIYTANLMAKTDEHKEKVRTAVIRNYKNFDAKYVEDKKLRNFLYDMRGY